VSFLFLRTLLGAGGSIVPGGVDNEVLEELASGRVDDPNFEVVDQAHDWGALDVRALAPIHVACRDRLQ
jgi:hypothetical protein